MADINLDEIETMTQALRRCVDASGLADKVVAAELGIEYGHFVRMMRETDARNFPQEKMPALMKLCGNVVPLEWLARQSGFCLYERSLHDVLLTIANAVTDGKGGLRFSILPSGTIIRIGD